MQGLDDKVFYRSSFFSTLDDVIEYSNQYMGIIAIEDIDSGEFIKRDDDTGEFTNELPKV